MKKIKAQTKSIRYVFIDVANFTQGRSVEAQTEIVAALNSVTKIALRRCRIDLTDTIMLPTGDGLGIAVINQTLATDIHLKLGLALLSEVNKRNLLVKDESRKFNIRVGINQNTDNIVMDINDRQNVAGAGVNLAQRIMDVGDASNLIVGEIVYYVISQREKYMKSFRRISARIKHDQQLTVYQFIANGHSGLDTNLPKTYQKTEPAKEYMLTEFDAYYMSYCIVLKDFIIANYDNIGTNYSPFVVTLWYIAKDKYLLKTKKPFDSYSKGTIGDGNLSVKQIFLQYNSVHFPIIQDLAIELGTKLSALGKYFDHGYLFINEAGVSKIQSDFPEILNLVKHDEVVQKAINSSK